MSHDTDPLLTAVRTIILTVPGFRSDSIVIDSWEFLDGSRGAAPWVRIESAGLVDADYTLMSGTRKTYMMPVVIVAAYTGDWDTTRAQLTSLRRQITSQADDNNAALPYMDDDLYRRVNHIRDVNPADPVQPVLTAAFLEALEQGDAIPDYLQLATLWEVVEECQ